MNDFSPSSNQLPEDGGMTLNMGGVAREFLQAPDTLDAAWVNSRLSEEDGDLVEYLFNLGIKYGAEEITRKAVWDILRSISGGGMSRWEAVMALTGQISASPPPSPPKRALNGLRRFLGARKAKKQAAEQPDGVKV